MDISSIKVSVHMEIEAPREKLFADIEVLVVVCRWFSSGSGCIRQKKRGAGSCVK